PCSTSVAASSCRSRRLCRSCRPRRLASLRCRSRPYRYLEALWARLRQETPHRTGRARRAVAPRGASSGDIGVGSTGSLTLEVELLLELCPTPRDSAHLAATSEKAILVLR